MESPNTTMNNSEWQTDITADNNTCIGECGLATRPFLHSKTPIPSVTYYKYSDGTVTTQWLNSDCVVTVNNCRQHSDYIVDQLYSHRAAGI